jgi:hypothetical protein
MARQGRLGQATSGPAGHSKVWQARLGEVGKAWQVRKVEVGIGVLRRGGAG